MRRAEDLVAAYVRAGYTKIHLDCSMPCEGDSLLLSDEIVAARAARLAAVAEHVAARTAAASELRYVIGTEVPIPGGAKETIDELKPTSPDAARATLAAHQRAFEAAGVPQAWDRVIALVVQPGVEFDSTQVVDYDWERTGALREVVQEYPGLVFEAHSTDYQNVEQLTHLVRTTGRCSRSAPGLLSRCARH
jgi:D-tagatose-1,6-bisphosphate aldolase subunit GatZ/KbaZ